MNEPLPRSRRPFLWAAGLLLVSTSLAAQTTPAGRLLASNCFQCHGTNGKGPGFDKLTGMSATKIYNELLEFRSGKEGDDLMAKHAMGYTDEQLRLLSAWLATQK